MTSDPRSTYATADVARGRFPFKMPDRALLIAFLRESAWVTCIWLVVYGGASWITSLHQYRVRLWTDRELTIPLVPAAAVVYLSLFPLLWLAPWVLHTREQLRSFAKSLAWLIVLSGVGFLLLPSDRAYPPPVLTGFFGAIYAVADRLNLNFNYLPSLHVGMATVCAYTYGRAAPATSLVFWLWAAAIAVSTLLMHEHYLIDVATGAALGYLVVTIFVP